MNILKKFCVLFCASLWCRVLPSVGLPLRPASPQKTPMQIPFLPLIRESQEWTPMAVLPFRSIPA